MKISALVLTKNEEKIIEDCLKQLSFADEIIVIDQNSQDKTRQIARKYTSKIITTDTTDFDKNRDILAKEAKFPWLFYLDADERVDEILIKEVKSLVNTEKFDAFYFPRKNFILGKWLKHGGWWPDYIPRLFKKSHLITWYGKIHESPKIKGTFGYAKTPITHLTAESLEEMFQKSIKWASVEAKLNFESKYDKVTSFKIIKLSLKEFTKRYFLKMGFLDGTVGLIESIYQALHQAMILTYLWELQNSGKDMFKKIENE